LLRLTKVNQTITNKNTRIETRVEVKEGEAEKSINLILGFCAFSKLSPLPANRQIRIFTKIQLVEKRNG
jgi:hypothetical protein